MSPKASETEARKVKHQSAQEILGHEALDVGLSTDDEHLGQWFRTCGSWTYPSRDLMGEAQAEIRTMQYHEITRRVTISL